MDNNEKPHAIAAREMTRRAMAEIESLAAKQRLDRAARNLAFGLACVACLRATEITRDVPSKHSIAMARDPLSVLRRAGLWTERGGGT